MARKVQDRTKRLSYVSRKSRNSSKEIEISSDDDISDVALRKKVRKEFSVFELRKDSEHFETDEDHIYSKSKNVDEIHGKPFGGVRRGCTTRSSSTLKSRREEIDLDVPKSGSIQDNSSLLKRQKCSSKNAVTARINRLKKKQYISSLEKNNKDLVEQNEALRENLRKQEETIVTLRNEIIYLKSLLANSKEISEILRSLRSSTGLPVSSSLQTTVQEDISMEYPHNQHLKAESYNNNGRQAHVKKVTSGLNFPILQDDVNLGDSISTDYSHDEFSNRMDDEPYLRFSDESDLSWDSILCNEDNFDFGSSMFDYPIDEECKTELDSIKEGDLIKTSDLSKVESDVGLCLHINKRKISVELCSICNSRAQSQQIDSSDC